MKPYSSVYRNKILQPYKNKIERRLSDMQGFFMEKTEGNPLIYIVYEMPAQVGPRELSYAITVIPPGKIGSEYYMTKGHYHSKEDAAEIYIGLEGSGILLMQNKSGEIETIKIKNNTVAYVPPEWAHRCINTGRRDFVFLTIYPSDAGHDYAAIEKEGFKKVVLEINGKPRLVKK